MVSVVIVVMHHIVGPFCHYLMLWHIIYNCLGVTYDLIHLQGGLPMYVATRGLYRMKPPTIIIPKCIKEDVEQLFEVHRRMDQSELKHNLIGLDIGNGQSSILSPTENWCLLLSSRHNFKLS